MSCPPTVQSRSLQNLQASRVLSVIDPPFSTEDESEPLHRHFPADRGLEDMNTLMGKLGVKQERSISETVSLNSSQVEGIGHFQVDPITGHIATVTLDPHRAAKLRPHADDMWNIQRNSPTCAPPNGRHRKGNCVLIIDVSFNIFSLWMSLPFLFFCDTVLYQYLDLNRTLKLPDKINCASPLALVKCPCKWLCLRLSETE